MKYIPIYRSVMLAAVLCTADTAAQSISGVGARPCRAFNLALAKDSDAALDAFVSWAQGFISAFNWSNVREIDVGVDASGIIQWLADYCAKAPEVRVHTALEHLIARNAR
jgi:hypothetical protein